MFLHPDLSNSYPPLDDACSVCGAGVSTAGWAWGSGGVQEGRGGAGWWNGRGGGRAGRGWAEQWGDDTVCHSVELGDGGSNGGRQVSIFLLVTLGPYAAQAVEGYHSDKQFLRETRWQGETIWIWETHCETERGFEIFVNETYSVQSGQLLCHFSHREVHKVAFVLLLRVRHSSILLICVFLLQRLTAVLWRRLTAICQTPQIINDNETGCKKNCISFTVHLNNIMVQQFLANGMITFCAKYYFIQTISPCFCCNPYIFFKKILVHSNFTIS